MGTSRIEASEPLGMDSILKKGILLADNTCNGSENNAGRSAVAKAKLSLPNMVVRPGIGVIGDPSASSGQSVRNPRASTSYKQLFKCSQSPNPNVLKSKGKKKDGTTETSVAEDYMPDSSSKKQKGASSIGKTNTSKSAMRQTTGVNYAAPAGFNRFRRT